MPKAIFGGWTSFNFDVSDEAKAVFGKALDGLTGVGYTPLAVATQVVAGINYCFLCKGEVVAPGGHQIAAKVYIFEPLPGQGDPRITDIEEIHP